MNARTSRLSAAAPVIAAAAAAASAEPATLPPEAAPAAAQAPAAVTEQPSADAPQLVPARVLRADRGYRPNEIVMLTVAEIVALDEDEWADPDPAAVAYARSLDA